MGVTACDASVFEALRAVANSETERVLATAHRIQMQLGQLPVGPEAVRLACETHMLMQPPVREVRREMRGGWWWARDGLFAALLQSLLTLSSSSPADPLHSHRMRISLIAPRLLARQAPHSPRHARTRTPPPHPPSPSLRAAPAGSGAGAQQPRAGVAAGRDCAGSRPPCCTCRMCCAGASRRGLRGVCQPRRGGGSRRCQCHNGARWRRAGGGRRLRCGRHGRVGAQRARGQH
jgi:hypothetical protein